MGPNPDFLLGGRTSASAECRHWSGRGSPLVKRRVVSWMVRSGRERAVVNGSLTRSEHHRSRPCEGTLSDDKRPSPSPPKPPVTAFLCRHEMRSTASIAALTTGIDIWQKPLATKKRPGLGKSRLQPVSPGWSRFVCTRALRRGQATEEGPTARPQRGATDTPGNRASLPAAASVVRCGNALARQASVDPQGFANSDLRQSSEQHHFALAFLARGRSLGIVVWSHSDCDYSICEGLDTRISTGDAFGMQRTSRTIRATWASAPPVAHRLPYLLTGRLPLVFFEAQCRLNRRTQAPHLSLRKSWSRLRAVPCERNRWCRGHLGAV